MLTWLVMQTMQRLSGVPESFIAASTLQVFSNPTHKPPAAVKLGLTMPKTLLASMLFLEYCQSPVISSIITAFNLRKNLLHDFQLSGSHILSLFFLHMESDKRNRNGQTKSDEELLKKNYLCSARCVRLGEHIQDLSFKIT